MKITKIASPYLGHRQYQTLTLDEPFMDATSLPKSKAILDKAPIEDYLTEHYDKNNYRSLMDFVLAVFSPEMDELIQKYYDGNGEKLIKLFSNDFIAKVDESIAGILNQLEKQLNKWNKTAYGRF